MLVRSSDRKTTAATNKAGTQASVKNAFGLLSGRDYSCPGATDACLGVCYAGRLEKMYPNVRKAMSANFDALVNASFDNMVTMLSQMIDGFVTDCDKRNADKIFRIHHDGDFFSADYARAWVSVIRAYPDITFWAYTRSFTDVLDVVPILTNPRPANLTLFLSVDADNVSHARRYFGKVKIAYLGRTFADAKALGNGESIAKCPELTKALPLISTKGGACSVCRLCVSGDGKANVAFASTKK